jgi:hypothetical protein
MRFRGGGVGHLGTRYLNSRLKGDNHDTGNEQQDEAIESVEEDLRVHEEHPASGRIPEPSTEEGEEVEDEDADEDEDAEEDDDEGDLEDADADEEQRASGNASDEQDLDSEDEEGMDDDEILDEGGFAEL